MEYKNRYNQWLTDNYFDDETRDELRNIAENAVEIEERFYKNLEFGTGGLRGVLCAGANRMNIYTVRKATQGLANYILKRVGADVSVCPSVVIAHDPRRFSAEFAETAALTLCGNGIKAYLFDGLRPTPVLSYAVRKLGCISGIVITASHNPPEYNGFKCYWSDGGQVSFPMDEEIIDEVNALESFSDIKYMDRTQAERAGLLHVLDNKIDDEYNVEILKQVVNPKTIKCMADDFRIVYTPLNGAGNVPVRRALSSAGFKHVHVVSEQADPDPNFTTVEYPNPEDPKAFTLARKLADKVDADIIVATDPDADRMGAIVKNSDGEYTFLSGNQIGVLLAEYVITGKRENGTMPPNPVTVTSIVSTNMTKAIADENGLAYVEVLTGFKYIGGKMTEFEENGAFNFVYGFEESFGYLAGTHARDKDGVVAVLLICEIAAYYKSLGMSVYDAMHKLYEKYGFYKEHIESVVMKGKNGLEEMARIMANLRICPPTMINGQKVVEVRDYENQVINKNGVTSSTDMPVSNVLYYVLADGSWFCIRPSGTEPKIKMYFGVKGSSYGDADEKLAVFVGEAMKCLGI